MVGAPFISMYLLEHVGMDLFHVLLLWTISWVGGALLSNQLGQWAERFGQRPVLVLCTAFKIDQHDRPAALPGRSDDRVLGAGADLHDRRVSERRHRDRQQRLHDQELAARESHDVHRRRHRLCRHGGRRGLDPGRRRHRRQRRLVVDASTARSTSTSTCCSPSAWCCGSSRPCWPRRFASPVRPAPGRGRRAAVGHADRACDRCKCRSRGASSRRRRCGPTFRRPPTKRRRRKSPKRVGDVRPDERFGPPAARSFLTVPRGALSICAARRIADAMWMNFLRPSARPRLPGTRCLEKLETPSTELGAALARRAVPSAAEVLVGLFVLLVVWFAGKILRPTAPRSH